MSDAVDSNLEWLLGPSAAPWLTRAAESTASELRLRRQLEVELSAEQARLVVQQVALRCRGVEKFGPLAEQMFFTELGLQQATDQCIAHYKARRFPAGVPVSDYCCGIGGDLVALAGRGPVVGWDHSAELVLLAAANLRAWQPLAPGRVERGAVEQHPPQAGEFWHLDPDRRMDGQRSTNPQWHSPNEVTISRWLAIAQRGAVKLAPATTLPDSWKQQAELEWISRGRECRQLVAWFGDLADFPGQGRATVVLPAGATDSAPGSVTFVGQAATQAPLANEVGDYLFDTDPAVRAAGLTGALAVSAGCEVLSTGASYLTGNHPVELPLLTRFRVEEVFPLRVSTLTRELKQRRIGQLEIKTRGVSAIPEQLRRRLKLHGDNTATLVLTRVGKREIAILAARQG